jgi:hypothetical protein
MSSSDQTHDATAIRDRIRDGSINADLLWTLGQAFGRTGSRPLSVTSWVHSRQPEADSGLDLSAEEVASLHAALVQLIDDHAPHPETPLAVWAVGKLARPDDEALFRRCVRRGLEGDDDLLYQAIISLSNLDALPAGITSFAAHDVDANREIGRRYLESGPRGMDG